MIYKLLLFDLDGTLLRSDKTISKRTMSVLQKCRERGLLIGVSTSRGEQNCLGFLEKLNPDILIASGGALVKYKEEYIYTAEFSVTETRDMIQTAREICGEDCEITIDTLEKHYWNYKIDPTVQDATWGDSVYSDFVDFQEKALKICVEIFEGAIATELANRFGDCDCVKFVDGDWYKFTKKEATKENAILMMCETCGIEQVEIIAFGDDLVDIGMLRLCGLGVAMGNALEEVKEAADVVIGSNDAEGIAEFLEKYLQETEQISRGEWMRVKKVMGVGMPKFADKDLAGLSATYQVRRLMETDIPTILTLCQGNSKYYQHCPPAVSGETIWHDMNALPPGKTMEDKYYLGFFEEDTLVAVLDLIIGFPDEKTAFWGFFMMNREYQGKGIGSKLVEEIINGLKEDFTAVRLGYVKGNEQSERFWKKNHFLPTGVESDTGEYVIVMTERKLW